MVDFPGAQGKMCDWSLVAAIEGAEQALSQLSKNAKIYIAASAADSNEMDIKKAFERVGLSKYISGYFCEANIGISKGSSEFYQTILAVLGKKASNVAMVGDSLRKDIVPVANIGIQTFWLTSSPEIKLPKNTKVIGGLSELHA